MMYVCRVIKASFQTTRVLWTEKWEEKESSSQITSVILLRVQTAAAAANIATNQNVKERGDIFHA